MSAAKLPVITPGLRHLLCVLMQDRPEKIRCGGNGEDGETYESLEEEKLLLVKGDGVGAEIQGAAGVQVYLLLRCGDRLF